MPTGKGGEWNLGGMTDSLFLRITNFSLYNEHTFMYYLYKEKNLKYFQKQDTTFLTKFFPQHKIGSLDVINHTFVLTSTCLISFHFPQDVP